MKSNKIRSSNSHINMRGGANNIVNNIKIYGPLSSIILTLLIMLIIGVVGKTEIINLPTNDNYFSSCIILLGIALLFGSVLMFNLSDNYREVPWAKVPRSVAQIIVGIIPIALLLVNAIINRTDISSYTALTENIIVAVLGLLFVVFGIITILESKLNSDTLQTTTNVDDTIANDSDNSETQISDEYVDDPIGDAYDTLANDIIADMHL